VLRIGVVYGAHNPTIVQRPLEHLVHGRLFLVECVDVPSNTIYVDNVCHGIRLALEADQSLNGETLLLSDDDGYTWGDYFGYFADHIGAKLQHVTKSSSKRSLPRPRLQRWLVSTRELVTSPELKGFVRRAYSSDPWGAPARWVVDTFPGGVHWLRDRLAPEQPFVYRPQVPAEEDTSPFLVDPIAAQVSTDKARRLIGFDSVVPRPRAMELTLAWARYARIVPSSTLENVEAATT
jgi:nucleoside-diphosphate-sugar epimerase